MASESYRVDYHLIQTIYFEPSHVPSGPEFAEIWSATRIFGKHRAVGNFWHANTLPASKSPRFEIGSLDLVEPLLAKGPQPIYGGGTYAPKNVARNGTLDADFYFALGEASRWQLGETMPSLLWTISGQWFETAGMEVVLNLLKENLVVADRHAPPYALIDLARPEESYAGMCYVSTWMQRLPLHRWVEQGNWVYAASKKGDRARGIYWGNYFGPKILNRLGGRENFVRRYRQQARCKDGSSSAHIWEFPNGVFVSMCLDPLGCKPGAPLDFAAMFNLRWLHRELASRGVLYGWDETDLPNSDSDSFAQPIDALAGEEQAIASSPSGLALNDAETQWIGDCLNQARGLAQKYVASRERSALGPSVLDQVFACWLAAWEKGESLEDPNTVVNSIGLAFGQHLVDRLGMHWAVVDGATGADMAVCFGAPENQVQVFPTHAVAKRLEARETGFLEPLFEIIQMQVKAAS